VSLNSLEKAEGVREHKRADVEVRSVFSPKRFISSINRSFLQNGSWMSSGLLDTGQKARE